MTDKKTYYAQLRAERKLAKEASTKMGALELQEIEAIRKVLPNMSGLGYYFVKVQMRQQNLDGLPGVDMKTFNGWKACGYKVKKGQKSLVHGLTWIRSGGSEGDDDGYMYPKVYHLFHKTQVEPLEAKQEVQKELREIVNNKTDDELDIQEKLYEEAVELEAKNIIQTTMTMINANNMQTAPLF